VSSKVVVDASFALKLVLPEPESAAVQELWSVWTATETEVYAPCHLLFEAVSVIRNQVYRRLLSPEQGEAAYNSIVAQEIVLIHPEWLDNAAWAVAGMHNLPTAYDAYYLALGGSMDCELWTADLRFIRAVRDNPHIRTITRS
jgi:predicted nucleic acid-binding protein